MGEGGVSSPVKGGGGGAHKWSPTSPSQPQALCSVHFLGAWAPGDPQIHSECHTSYNELKGAQRPAMLRRLMGGETSSIWTTVLPDQGVVVGRVGCCTGGLIMFMFKYIDSK